MSEEVGILLVTLVGMVVLFVRYVLPQPVLDARRLAGVAGRLQAVFDADPARLPTRLWQAERIEGDLRHEIGRLHGQPALRARAEALLDASRAARARVGGPGAPSFTGAFAAWQEPAP